MISFNALFHSLTAEDYISFSSLDDYDSSEKGRCVCWDYGDNGYFASGTMNSSKGTIVYSWNGTDTIGEAESVNTSSAVNALEFDSGGNYLFTTPTNSSLLKAYSWNGSDTLTEVESVSTTMTYAERISVTSDNSFVALAGSSASQGVEIFSWNGSDTLTEVENANPGSTAASIDWNSDDTQLAVGANGGTQEITIYSWNGSDTLAEIETVNLSASYVRGMKWSSDDSYLFVGADDDLIVYSWNGSDTLTQIDSVSVGSGYTIREIDVYDDKHIVVAKGKTKATQEVMDAYYFNGTSLIEKDNVTLNAYGMLGVRFNNNGSQVACAVYDETNVTVRVYSTGL